jgi:competence protein ComEC
VIRRLVEINWPALLVTAMCFGIALANWVRAPPIALAAGLALAAVALVVVRGGLALLVLAVGLGIAGLWWGGLRDAALDRSVLASRVGDAERAVVTVTAPPRVSTYSIRAFVIVSRFGGQAMHERALLELPAGRAPPLGAILLVRSRVTAPRGPDEGFDERGWLDRQGIHVVLKAREATVIGHRAGLAGLADRLRGHIAQAIARGTSGERRAILTGVVLGADEGLDGELKDAFRASGLYHLLAVSGQNVALIALGVAGIAWLLGVGSLAAQAWTIAAVLMYLFAVGWQPSVVRAGVAGCLASLAWLVARPRDRWHFLALGALVLLAWNPRTLFDPGFQLSFVAVAAIFVLVPRLRQHLDGYPIPPGLADVLAVSSACGLVTAPVLLLDFGTVPLYSVPANVLAEPAMPAVLGLGLGSALLTPVFPSAGTSLAWLAGWPAAWLAGCARVFDGLPFATVGPAWPLAVGFLSALGVALRRLPKRSRRPVALAILPSALATVAVAYWFVWPAPTWSPPNGLRVTFLDVGQGDSALIETPTAAVLVDQGPPEANVAGQLRRRGVRSLSALVLTHPQRDHVGGATDVLRRLHVATILDPAIPFDSEFERAALKLAHIREIPIVMARAGDRYRIGRLRIRVLWPDGPGPPGDDPNNRATVLLVSYGRTDILLTADAESDVTRRLALRPVEVLKVAHHGSEDTGLADQLATLRPRVAVISVGSGNDYGHPRPETVQALESVPGLALYRTDQDGYVTVESDGESIAVASQR